MVKTELNITRYLELLKKEKNLQNEGKGLIGEILQGTENRDDGMELLEYRAILSSTIALSERKNYSALIEQYLEEKISTGAFDGSFSSMWCKIRDRSRSLQKTVEEDLLKNAVPTIWVDSRAKRYSALINYIFSLNDHLTDDPVDDDDDLNDLIEKEHRNEIKQIFDEMKELLQEE